MGSLIKKSILYRKYIGPLKLHRNCFVFKICRWISAFRREKYIEKIFGEKCKNWYSFGLWKSFTFTFYFIFSLSLSKIATLPPACLKTVHLGVRSSFPTSYQQILCVSVFVCARTCLCVWVCVCLCSNVHMTPRFYSVYCSIINWAIKTKWSWFPPSGR